MCVESEQLTFTIEEVVDTLTEKKKETSYIIRTNVEHAILFGLCGILFLYISSFYSLYMELQFCAVLTGISFLLASMIFISKFIKDFSLLDEIKKLQTQLLNETCQIQEEDIQIRELCIVSIISKPTKIYVRTEDEEEYQMVTPYVPEYIFKRKIHVLTVCDKIVDYFYF